MITPIDVELALKLFEIFKSAQAALKSLKDGKPEVYAEIGKRHKDAGALLDAAVA